MSGDAAIGATTVMAVLVTAIHIVAAQQVVDGRNKSGHDAERLSAPMSGSGAE